MTKENPCIQSSGLKDEDLLVYFKRKATVKLIKDLNKLIAQVDALYPKAGIGGDLQCTIKDVESAFDDEATGVCLTCGEALGDRGSFGVYCDVHETW